MLAGKGFAFFGDDFASQQLEIPFDLLAGLLQQHASLLDLLLECGASGLQRGIVGGQLTAFLGQLAALSSQPFEFKIIAARGFLQSFQAK